MAHHGPNPFDGHEPEMTPEANAERAKILRNLLDATGFRGALGNYTDGKLTPQDEGAIQFAIGEMNGKVVIDYGTAVHWVAMTPQQAADFASAVLKRARAAARKNGETVGFTIA